LAGVHEEGASPSGQRSSCWHAARRPLCATWNRGQVEVSVSPCISRARGTPISASEEEGRVLLDLVLPPVYTSEVQEARYSSEMQ
jgi:hypothetical protein